MRTPFNRKVYTVAELQIIANALNVLTTDTSECKGAIVNTYQFSRYYNSTHYIDYNDRLKVFKCYKKYTGWEPIEKREHILPKSK